MKNNFRFRALDGIQFEEYFHISNEELRRSGIVKMVADTFPGFPCRVSLADAEVGEEVILLNYEHHAVNTPYRSNGPIYVRKSAKTASPAVNEIPKMFDHRLLSVRGFNKESFLILADVTQGDKLNKVLDEFLDNQRISYIHIHNAKPGCFNCLVERV